MKANTPILLLATAVIALPCMSLAKPPEGERPSRGERGNKGERPERPSKEEMLAKFDKDADGKLSPQERVPMLKERMKKQPKFADRLKKKYDADKDGKLSDAELLEAAKKMRKGKKGGKKPKGE